MNIADIITEFGNYYLKNGQNMSRVVQQLYQPSVTDMVMTPFITDETTWRASESRFQRVLQPFQKAWTPIGETEFVPVEIRQFKQKIDTQEYPDELEGSWLGFLASNSLDRKTWPFVRWFIESHLLPQAKEDYELSEVYGGVARAIVASSAGAAGTSIDGIKYGINNGILAGRTVVINTGALSTDPVTFVGQIEAFVDAINTLYWNIPLDLNMNQTLERRFARGYHTKYGQDTNYRDNPKGAVKFSNITIQGLPSMAASDKIWCTPKSNIIHLGKKTVNQNGVQVENVDRLVKMYSDWWSGVGFVIPEIIFTNDRDLGLPVISSFSGSPVAAGGQTVTVTGRDFNDVTAVKIDGTDVTSFVVTYSKGWTEITFVSPAIAAGAYPINITNKFGTTASSNITVGA
jgi:hypothetical protein